MKIMKKAEKAFCLLLMALILVVCKNPALFAASPLTASEAIGLVRNLNLPDEKITSLAVDMQMSLPLPLDIVCHLRYCAPDRYSLKVFDSFDDTPVLIVCNNTAMINDPLAEDVSIIASSGVVFEFVPQEGQYNANFAFNAPEDGQIKNRVEIDLTSLFARLEKNLTVVNTSESLIISGTSQQNSSCSAEIRPNEFFVVKTLKLFSDNNPKPVLNFADIAVNGPINDEDFGFPWPRLKESQIKITRLENSGIFDVAMVLPTILRAVFARAAIRNPECRNQIEAMLGTSIDWKILGEKDQIKAQRLKGIFSGSH
jgi:hypothetical protein